MTAEAAQELGLEPGVMAVAAVKATTVVIELPPDFHAYPEHDHLKDGQEEVYVALAGSGQVEIDGSMRLELDAETIVRVGPAHRRRVLAGDEGLRVLTVGGTPGRAYRAPVFSDLGAPDSAPRAGPPPEQESD